MIFYSKCKQIDFQLKLLLFKLKVNNTDMFIHMQHQTGHDFPVPFYKM